ncbi:unnamed protein product, partial [Mesorhabditis spiculigera]
MAELQQFGALVAQMLDCDNAKRKAAEEQYEQIDHITKITMLFRLYQEKTIRSMALVLTRRLWDYDFEAAWEKLNEAQRDQYLDGIFHATTEETSLPLMKKLADIIAQFGMNLIDDETGAQKCPKIIQFIELCSSSDNPNLKVVAMAILENVPNVFGSDLDKYVPGVKSIFNAGLNHEAGFVRSSAVKAYSAFLCDNEENDKVIKGLVPFIGQVLKICQHIVATEDEDDVPLQSVADLVTTIPKPLGPHINDIITFSLQTVNNAETNEIFRHSALEILASLCEAAPNMVKKRAQAHISPIVQACIFMMTDLNDELEDWLAVDDAEDETEEETAAIGETSLDRIACALGGKAVLEPSLAAVNSLLVDPDWKKRHAAVFVLSTIGEGCQRSMEPKIQPIVEKLIPYLNDPHPRVQYAVCNALGQMSTDFAPHLQKHCHEKVVSALLSCLVRLDCPRVAAHAGAALVNFTEDCPKNIIQPYLPKIMESLEQVLEATFKQLVEKNKKLVLEQVITTVASVADCAQDLFVQYYSRMIGPLKYILQNSEADEYKLLRGKTIECVSLIGLAVGRETFADDGRQIMDMLASTIPNLAPDDPQTSYMISSWTRICKVLGPLFAPYLPIVMPAIMRSVEYSPDLTMVEEEEVDQSDPAWTYQPMGDNKHFGIRTAGLEEKVTACEMLVCYARELKELFAPYVEQVLTQVLKNLKFLFHEGVRSSSAEVLPGLLECCKDQGVEVMLRLWQVYIPALLEAIKAEPELDVLTDQLAAIAQSVDVLGGAIGPAGFQMIAEVLKEQLEGFETRRGEREAKEVDEDADPEEAHDNADEEAESDAAVLSSIADIFHACFKNIGPQFYPYIEPLLDGIVKMIDPARDYTDRQWGVCIVDDLIEFAPQEAHRAQGAFVSRLVAGLKDPYPEVKQAAAYGFGVMALQGGIFTDVCVQALPHLAEMIGAPDSRATNEGTIATENGISAVAKILKHCSGQINPAQAIPLFISWLPTYHDAEESVHIYGLLADLIETNNPDAIHNEAFEEGKEEAEMVKGRLVQILRVVSADHSIVQTCVQQAGLDDAEKATLQKILS